MLVHHLGYVCNEGLAGSMIALKAHVEAHHQTLYSGVVVTQQEHP